PVSRSATREPRSMAPAAPRRDRRAALCVPGLRPVRDARRGDLASTSARRAQRHRVPGVPRPVRRGIRGVRGARRLRLGSAGRIDVRIATRGGSMRATRRLFIGISLALAGTLAFAQASYKLTLSGASPSGLWTILGVGIDGAVKAAFPGSTV